jgi:hypothetical protein
MAGLGYYVCSVLLFDPGVCFYGFFFFLSPVTLYFRAHLMRRRLSVLLFYFAFFTKPFFFSRKPFVPLHIQPSKSQRSIEPKAAG